MGNMMILNGSPRAVKSNSKQYAEIFMKYYDGKSEYYNITKTNHADLCEKIDSFSNVLFVFPLYADGLPVTLLNFLKALEENPPHNKPVISVIVNCGFYEYQQNDTAVRMMQLFCRQNGYKFGTTVKIGSGEAILNTVFKVFVVSKIKKAAKAIKKNRHKIFNVTMPISKKMFLKASYNYWTMYGKRNGVSVEEMNTMEIE